MLSSQSVSVAAIYLLDDGLGELTLWVGAHATPAFLEALFGSSRPTDETNLLSSGANDDVTRLHAIIDSLGESRASTPRLSVVVQGSPRESRFFSRLVSEGYETFALKLHDKVAPKL